MTKPVKEICRKHGISDATYYNWKLKYGGMNASDLKRRKEMEREQGWSGFLGQGTGLYKW